MRLKVKYELLYTPHYLNFFLFAVGMVGVWEVTHSTAALLFTSLASLHITFKPRYK